MAGPEREPVTLHFNSSGVQISGNQSNNSDPDIVQYDALSSDPNYKVEKVKTIKDFLKLNLKKIRF